MAKIHIIGVTQATDLAGDALLAVQQADAIIGSERQLEIVKPHLLGNANIVLNVLPKLEKLKPLIEKLSLELASDQSSSVVVLASGDPLYYGIGRWFSKNFNQERLVFYPAISSIQMACHRLAISLQDVTVISLHGRPLASLRTKLKNATKLLILTDADSHPQALARECLDTGFERSTITVLENLSYPHERIRTYTVEQLLGGLAPLEGSQSKEGSQPAEGSQSNDALDIGENFDPLHVSVIDVQGSGGVLPEFPGIPDSSYTTGAEAGKGMITKREVRLCILSLLQPANEDVIWDVGAGCGGVAVELAYWNDSATVYAVECDAERLTHLAANQRHFGVVKNLHIVNGHAPECLTDLPLPNKVFIGGSGGDMKALLEVVWPLLPNDGLLVVSAVVSKTKQVLKEFAENLPIHAVADIESVEVSVKRGQLTTSGLDYTAKLPVEVFKFTKSAGSSTIDVSTLNVESELGFNKIGNQQ